MINFYRFNFFKNIILIIVIISINISSNLNKKIKMGYVISVKDGDTIEIIDNKRKKIKIRFAEVDCPEKNQPFGNVAKNFTSEQIFNKNIKYQQCSIDRYNRIIAKVYYDNNKYISEELIKNGLGWFYKEYSNNKELEKLEQYARNRRIGLWKDKNPIYPSKWRKKNKKNNTLNKRNFISNIINIFLYSLN